MAKKKRAPIEQLRQAGKIAKEMAIKRGLRTENSVIDDILQNANAPKLPGIPSYLPHEWTLKAAQRIMYDLLVMWRDETKEDAKRAENITAFWTFVIQQLRAQEKVFDEEMKDMPRLVKMSATAPLLKDIFGPMRKKENVKAIQHFFVDAFAVSIVIKSNVCVSDFVNWFVDWTEELYKFWIKPVEKGKIEEK